MASIEWWKAKKVVSLVIVRFPRRLINTMLVCGVR